jgi:hypothetical protein
MGENVFSEFFWDNWAKDACCKVASKALSAEAATVSIDSGGVGKGETKNQQKCFSNLADTTSAHCCWQGERDKAVTSDL